MAKQARRAHALIMARNALVFALSLLTFVGLAGAASADERYPHGDLLCDGKAAIAVVRFTTSFNEERPVYRRLPVAVDGGLSADSGSDRTDCRLPDGKTVRLRIGVEQAFAYGMGGADPSSFFSLWIDKRKVLSKRVWRVGYGQDDLPILVGLVIRSERLTFCDANEGSANVSCHEERLTLGSFPIDSVEYGGSTPKPGTMLLGRSRDPAFCRRYLKALGNSERLFREDTPFTPAISWDEPRLIAGALVTSAQVVPAPKARPLRVMAFSGTHRLFDGDVYVFTPLSASPADVEAFWKSGDGDPKSIPARPRPAGWSVISGGVPDLYPQLSARYVHLSHPRQIDGRLYVLAYPTNSKNRPTAVLLIVTPEPKAAPVCEFQRVEPNF